jgi:hypothetical protein
MKLVFGPKYRRGVTAVLVVALCATMALGAFLPGHGPGVDGRSHFTPFVTNVTFVSTVDAWPLSYLEALPAGYSNGTGASLVVFLPGLGGSTANVSGGTGATTWSAAFQANASTFGFIALSVNTRSAAGYYTNTPCGGPQATDIVDAIASEKRRQHVTATYLVGFSGGSAAALALTANHELGTISGIATAGTITDMSQVLDFLGTSSSRYNQWVTNECGHAPNSSNHRSAGDLLNLSAFRYHPENLSGVRLFLAAGGADTNAPSNYSEWAYSNLNSTTRLASCQATTDFGLPANCTKPLVNLTRTQPWAAAYELKSGHQESQLPYQSVFNFWIGKRTDGFYTGTSPPVTLTTQTFSWEHFPTEGTVQAFACGSGAGANLAPLNMPAGSAIYILAMLRQNTAQTATSIVDTAGDTIPSIAQKIAPANSKVQLWVVNSTIGNAANRVNITWSGTTASCVWVVNVAGAKATASYSVLGAGSKGTNTTAGDPLTPGTRRNLILMGVAEGNATRTYSALAGTGLIHQGTVSTSFSGAAAVLNRTIPAAIYPQLSINASSTWSALAVAIQPPGPVPKVTNLNSNGTTGSSVTLRWTVAANATGVLNATVFFGATCNAWTGSFGSGSTANYTTVTGLAPATTYCFAVELWNISGPGLLSGFTNATTTSGGGLAPIGSGTSILFGFLVGELVLAIVVAAVSMGRKR